MDNIQNSLMEFQPSVKTTNLAIVVLETNKKVNTL